MPWAPQKSRKYINKAKLSNAKRQKHFPRHVSALTRSSAITGTAGIHIHTSIRIYLYMENWEKAQGKGERSGDPQTAFSPDFRVCWLEFIFLCYGKTSPSGRSLICLFPATFHLFPAVSLCHYVTERVAPCCLYHLPITKLESLPCNISLAENKGTIKRQLWSK